jgi:ribosome maturation factor RimP
VGAGELYRDIPDDLKTLIEPIVDGQGCELVNLEVIRGAGSTLLRVTLDSPAGDGRVSVECCAEVSREIESQLEAAEAIPGAYRLEVSSPGLDRVLAREKDFAAACGSEVRVQTRRPLNGRRRFKGVLLAFSDGIARVEVDGTETEIPFEEIEKANTVYKFSRADFSGRSAN